MRHSCLALTLLLMPSTMSPPSGYTRGQLIFEDVFSTSSLDTTKWNPWWGQDSTGRWNDNGNLPSPYSGANAGSYDLDYADPYPSAYSTNTTGNHLVTGGGGLQEIATPSSFFTSIGYTWASAALTSYGHWYIPATGGYLQVRALLPDMSHGAWPALWLLPGNVGNDGAEFDILDGGVNCTTGACANVTVDSKWFGTGETSTVNTGVDLTAGYHVYGFQYCPGTSFKVFLDGTLLHTWTSGVSVSANYEVIITHEIASDSASGFHPITSPSFPGPYIYRVNDVQLYSGCH